jgi:hypothetical protein
MGSVNAPLVSGQSWNPFFLKLPTFKPTTAATYPTAVGLGALSNSGLSVYGVTLKIAPRPAAPPPAVVP